MQMKLLTLIGERVLIKCPLFTFFFSLFRSHERKKRKKKRKKRSRSPRLSEDELYGDDDVDRRSTSKSPERFKDSKGKSKKGGQGNEDKKITISSISDIPTFSEEKKRVKEEEEKAKEKEREEEEERKKEKEREEMEQEQEREERERAAQAAVDSGKKEAESVRLASQAAKLSYEIEKLQKKLSRPPPMHHHHHQQQ